VARHEVLPLEPLVARSAAMSVEAQVSEQRLAQVSALHEARLSDVIHINGTLIGACAGERCLSGMAGPKSSQ
jgi:hypothetical protein